MINFSSLESLSKVLNHQNIIWGVGGSCLLSLHHLYENPHDLDLWVQPSDMSKLRIIFKEYQELPNDLPLPEKYRYRIKFHDTDVDFIACFIVKPNQHTFEYNINPNNLEYINCNGFKIPCTYLEDWYIIYRLLRKDDKADIIKKVFEAKKIWINDNAIRTAVRVYPNGTVTPCLNHSVIADKGDQKELKDRIYDAYDVLGKCEVFHIAEEKLIL